MNIKKHPRRNPVQIRLTDKELKELDHNRKKMTRSDYIRKILNDNKQGC